MVDIIDSKDHVIHFNYAADSFYADPQRTGQVLTNLLQNSVRYVPKGRKIWVNWSETQDGKVRLSVVRGVLKNTTLGCLSGSTN